MRINEPIPVNVNLLKYFCARDPSVLQSLHQMIKYLILKLLTPTL